MFSVQSLSQTVKDFSNCYTIGWSLFPFHFSPSGGVRSAISVSVYRRHDVLTLKSATVHSQSRDITIQYAFILTYFLTQTTNSQSWNVYVHVKTNY